MKKLFVLILPFCLLSLNLMSQENVRLSYTVSGNLIAIQAEVNGKSGYFLIDTGVEHLVLNQTYFSGRPAEKEFHHFLGQWKGGEFDYVRLRIGEGFSVRVYADIIDLSQVEASLDISVYGLIGTHVLRSFEVVYFNFKNQELILARDAEGVYMQHSPPKDIIDFVWKGYMPSISMQVDGQSLQFALDTGAGMNLISHSKKKDLLSLRPPGVRKVTLRGFGTKTTINSMSKLRGLKVGSRTCPPLHFAFAPLIQLNEGLGGQLVSGIIGYQAFGAMQMAIQFRKKQILLWGPYPNNVKPELSVLNMQEVKIE